LSWIKKYADRITAVHVKDIAPKGENLDEDGWADVGKGTVNWPACFKALAKTKTLSYILEHDNPNDLARFAKRSFDYVMKA
jgi:sugar phosphate isomerase/epimerase